MSTKIFVHVQRKIKPPKPPDPAIELALERERQEAEQRKARHAESKRLQAELRRQELASRPAPPPPPPPPRIMERREFHEWAKCVAIRLLTNNNKWMVKLKKVASLHQGKIRMKTFASIHDELTIAVVRAAEALGQPNGDKEVEEIAGLTAVTLAEVTCEFYEMIQELEPHDAKGRADGGGASFGEEKGGQIHFEKWGAAKLARET